MKKLLLILLTSFIGLFFAQGLYAQKKEKVEGVIFKFVDTNPAYVGGRDAMLEFLNTNMVMPKKAKKKGLKGKVYLEFIVKADGEIVNIKINKSSDKIFEKEAIRLFTMMPKWNPAILNGNNVNCRHIFPIKFGYDCVLESN